MLLLAFNLVLIVFSAVRMNTTGDVTDPQTPQATSDPAITEPEPIETEEPLPAEPEPISAEDARLQVYYVNLNDSNARYDTFLDERGWGMEADGYLTTGYLLYDEWLESQTLRVKNSGGIVRICGYDEEKNLLLSLSEGEFTVFDEENGVLAVDIPQDVAGVCFLRVCVALPETENVTPVITLNQEITPRQYEINEAVEGSDDSSALALLSLLDALAAEKTVEAPDPLAETEQTYIVAESDRVISDMSRYMGENTSSFAFVTDLHYMGTPDITYITKNITRALNRIGANGALRFVAFGGDNLAETSPDIAAHLVRARKFSSLLSGIEIPYIVLKGNHDDNSISSYIQTGGYNTFGYEMSDSQFYYYFWRNHSDIFEESDREDGLYGYTDLAESKTRVIFLNSSDIPYIVRDGALVYTGIHDYGYSGEQLSWLAGTALDFSAKEVPSDWGVILIEHIPFSTQMYDDSVRNNADVLNGILAAYAAGGTYTASNETGDFPYSVSVDFTTQGPGEIIAEICGHNHCDQDLCNNGILEVSTMQAGTDDVGYHAAVDGETYRKVVNSADETAFDVFTVDRELGILAATRYGAGKNRLFHYADLLLTVGEEVMLTPLSEGTLTWSSGDSAVATVSETGIVTAHAAGTVRIAATDADGNYEIFYITVG